ncbi:hypothetical protein J3R74_001449 [Puniceicoccus vermicola]
MRRRNLRLLRRSEFDADRGELKQVAAQLQLRGPAVTEGFPGCGPKHTRWGQLKLRPYREVAAQLQLRGPVVAEGFLGAIPNRRDWGQLKPRPDGEIFLPGR